MATPHTTQSTDGNQFKDFDEVDAHLLEQTVEKLVRFGQQVGVTPEEMISLLDSGISIHDLLAFLASKSSPIRRHPPSALEAGSIRRPRAMRSRVPAFAE